jgi:hypothetical protein
MRYMVLLLLATVAIVACANSDAPSCTSSETAAALHEYLLDANEYGPSPDPKLAGVLSAATVTLANLKTIGQDAGLNASRCQATVHMEAAGKKIDQELPFNDHFPGDKIHVVDADLTSIRAQLNDATK